MLTRVQVGDYEAWKPMFDSDPAGVRKAATGHRVFRSNANPNEVFIAVEFPSQNEADAGREQLVASGVMDRVEVLNGPTVVELADEAKY